MALLVWKIEPPEMVRPAVEDSPPTCAESPPRRVEVDVFRTDRLEIVEVPRNEGIFVARRFPPVIVAPFEEAREFVEIPPTNVDVAVDVAIILAKLGVVVPTTLPDESVERIMLGPTLLN